MKYGEEENFKKLTVLASRVITLRKLYIGRESCYILQLYTGKQRRTEKKFLKK